MKEIKVMAWNINAVKTKLEKPVGEALLLHYETVSLSETKMDLCEQYFVSPWRHGCYGEHFLARYIANVDVDEMYP